MSIKPCPSPSPQNTEHLEGSSQLALQVRKLCSLTASPGSKAAVWLWTSMFPVLGLFFIFKWESKFLPASKNYLETQWNPNWNAHAALHLLTQNIRSSAKKGNVAGSAGQLKQGGTRWHVALDTVRGEYVCVHTCKPVSGYVHAFVSLSATVVI